MIKKRLANHILLTSLVSAVVLSGCTATSSTETTTTEKASAESTSERVTEETSEAETRETTESATEEETMESTLEDSETSMEESENETEASEEETPAEDTQEESSEEETAKETSKDTPGKVPESTAKPVADNPTKAKPTTEAPTTVAPTTAKPTEAPTREPVAKQITASISGTYYVGDTIPATAITVNVYMTDGSVKTNPCGWGATPLTLTSTSNIIHVMYHGLETTVTVKAATRPTQPTQPPQPPQPTQPPSNPQPEQPVVQNKKIVSIDWKPTGTGKVGEKATAINASHLMVTFSDGTQTDFAWEPDFTEKNLDFSNAIIKEDKSFIYTVNYKGMSYTGTGYVWMLVDTWDHELAKAYFDCQNAERRKLGLPEFIWDDALYQKAMAGAKAMSDKLVSVGGDINKFGSMHDASRVAIDLDNDQGLTENCQHTAIGATLEDVHWLLSGIMDSPGHAAKVKSTYYKKAAIAIYNCPIGDVIFIDMLYHK